MYSQPHDTYQAHTPAANIEGLANTMQTAASAAKGAIVTVASLEHVALPNTTLTVQLTESIDDQGQLSRCRQDERCYKTCRQQFIYEKNW